MIVAESAKLEKLQDTLGITFNDYSILQQALVHGSYLHENPDFAPPTSAWSSSAIPCWASSSPRSCITISPISPKGV
jgi:hypothetical protein